MHTYRIAAWMSSPPIVVVTTTTLADAQRMMEQLHVRRLPVVQSGRLVGIITESDLRAAWPSAATTLSVQESRELLEQATVAECMSRDPVTVAPDASVREAARIMLAHKIGGVPVVADGELVGLITESDLLRLLMTETTENRPAALGRCQSARTVAPCRP